MSLTIATQLCDAGKAKEALAALDTMPRRNLEAEVLRVELLETLGRFSEAEVTAKRLSTNGGLSDSELSRVELVSARPSEKGDFDNEMSHLIKAISLAERAPDLKCLCWSQLWLLPLTADRSGLESAASLFRSLRQNVTKLGDPSVTAALHLFIAELDGKRGLVTEAIRHTALAQSLLARAPNLRLEAWVHNNFLALHMMACDFERAATHGIDALQTSTESGSIAAIRRCYGNLGRLHLMTGDFATATELIEKAIQHSSTNSEHMNATSETMARILVANGRLEEALLLLNKIQDSIQHPNGTGRYVHRHSLLTRSDTLLRLGHTLESLRCLDNVATLARTAGDSALLVRAHLLQAEAAIAQGRLIEAWKFLGDGTQDVRRYSPELYGSYERVVACGLRAEGKHHFSQSHFGRALRAYEGLRNVPSSIEIKRTSEQNSDQSVEQLSSIPAASVATLDVLHGVTAMLSYSGRPELLATELIAILRSLDNVAGAVAFSLDEDGHREVLAAFGATPSGDGIRSFALGTSRRRQIAVDVQPKADVESLVALNGVGLLLRTVQDLEQARVEREQRLTLWPLEERPAGEDSVVMGAMERIMALARKVAQTDISVLITGESGTGKEVLARAIHSFSPRGKRSFIPFNCTAIPRELLESQLFGFRRGSFTGADRDSTGLIRAAKDGTLFLDEIGELSLDLQPKLLRFLESGEINPLGESMPFRVDVRIVAATNANLPQLVREGRFREDLYYRLDVVALEMPPLRERRDEIPALVHHFTSRAASEFKKGRLRVAEDTMEHLILYSWPGNIRQLQNEIRRLVALADVDMVIEPSVLSQPIRQETDSAIRGRSTPVSPSVPVGEKLGPTVARLEREMIRAALSANDGHLEATARSLGISRKGLYLKRQRLGI